MREYAAFMKKKMKPLHKRKEPDRDLGLAAIDSTVMLEQMARNDSHNFHLMKTTDIRASL